MLVCISMLFLLTIECMLIHVYVSHIPVCLLCLVFKFGDDIEVRSNYVLRAKSRNLMSNNLKTANYDCVLLVLELSLDR